jgi:uncharacterized protein (DUF169 family)
MDETRFLENRFGGRWCGIKFDWDGNGQDCSEKRPISFSQAIAQSQNWPIALTQELMDCPGGSYSLGWYEDVNCFPKQLAKKSGLLIGKAEGIINQTAHLNGEVKQVVIGVRNKPDVLISLAQPEIVMKIIQQWQRLYGCHIMIETSGYMSICSSVAVRAFLTDQICISFGCSDSRKRTKIGRDRLIIGFSRRRVALLQKHVDEIEKEKINEIPGTTCCSYS